MEISKKQFKELCALQIETKIAYCYLCGKPIARKKDYNIDHVQPKSRGGLDSASNWRPVHRTCNQRKGSLTYEEYKLWLELEAKRHGHIK